MNKNIAIALIAGLVGGMASRYFSPTPVHAQAQTPPAREVRAQSFTLVDGSDRALGTFSAERVYSARVRNPAKPDQVVDLAPARIVLRDPYGRELWRAEPSGAGISPLTLK